MPNTITSPNMGMPVPVVSTDPGPDWATNLNASLSIIDSHSHAPGQGVQITPNGMDINADLTFEGNNATQLRSVRFTSQVSPLANAADIGCLYESGVDLYYNDGSGNQVRITQSGSVTGSAGTITGLPSGTASASFAAGTFTFQSATNTPATMAFGPLVLGTSTVSPHTVTFSTPSGLAANYNMTLPSSVGATNQVLVTDGSGNLSWSLGLLPIGSVVATFPNLTGAYSTVATTTADAHGFVLCAGQTIADASSPMNGQVVPNINNSVFLQGSTTGGTTGGSATSSAVPSHTHTFTSTTIVPQASHHHNFAHYHIWAHNTVSGSADSTYVLTSGSTAATSIPATTLYIKDFATDSGTNSLRAVIDINSNVDLYTTGVLAAASGDGASALTASTTDTTAVAGTTDANSATTISTIPPYITAVYLMRVK